MLLQTWEFSHHKFLRGRPDLLDEIKRKALLEGQGGISVGPESVRARVELPGEVSVYTSRRRTLSFFFPRLHLSSDQ